MSSPFFQQPFGVATLIGGAVLGPYLFFGEPNAAVSNSQSPAAATLQQPIPSNPSPGYGGSMGPYDQQAYFAPGQMGWNGEYSAPPPAALPGVVDLREVIRFDIHPAWLTQNFPQVSRVQTEMRMDAWRAPFLSGNLPTDIVGSLTYSFDANQSVRRIQFHGATGDPSMLVALMTQFYRLQAEPHLGGQLFTTRWNNRVTSVMQITPATVIYSHEPNNRHQVFLELNQPSNDYGLSSEAEQLLQAGRFNQHW
jgi:hypothetical protein